MIAAGQPRGRTGGRKLPQDRPMTDVFGTPYGEGMRSYRFGFYTTAVQGRRAVWREDPKGGGTYLGTADTDEEGLLRAVRKLVGEGALRAVLPSELRPGDVILPRGSRHTEVVERVKQCPLTGRIALTTRHPVLASRNYLHTYPACQHVLAIGENHAEG